MRLADQGAAHRIISSKEAFEGRVIKVFVDEVRLPDGRTVEWERVAHPGAVGMVPLLPDRTVVMVRQYRNAIGGELLEIPAGKLDRGEAPEACARRELAEEVGLSAGRLIKLAEFYNSPGYADEYFHVYLAMELAEACGETEQDEFLTVERYGLDELVEMIAVGRLSDAKSIIGLSLASLYLKGELSEFGGEARR